MPYQHAYPQKRCCTSEISSDLVCKRQHMQDGAGFIDLVKKAASKISGIDFEQPPRFPGEMHAIGLSGKDKGKLYEYAGPKTAIKQRIEQDIKPINKIDAAAKKHDISYMETSDAFKAKKLTKKQAKQVIFEADRQFKADVEQAKDVDPILAKIAQSAISLKEVGERLGVLPINTFSLSGSGFMDVENATHDVKSEVLRLEGRYGSKPGDNLKREAGLLKGGAVPALLIPIIASLAGTALGKLWDVLTKKKEGSGVVSDDKLRDKIMDKLSVLPDDVQFTKVIAAIK